MGVGELGVALLLGMFLLLAAAEIVAPARSFPGIPGWRWTCAALIPIALGVAISVPRVVEEFGGNRALLGGHHLGVSAGQWSVSCPPSC